MTCQSQSDIPIARPRIDNNVASCGPTAARNGVGQNTYNYMDVPIIRLEGKILARLFGIFIGQWREGRDDKRRVYHTISLYVSVRIVDGDEVGHFDVGLKWFSRSVGIIVFLERKEL